MATGIWLRLVRSDGRVEWTLTHHSGWREWLLLLVAGFGDVESAGAQSLTLTKLPGASSMGASLPPPGSRAGTLVGSCFLIHSSQSGHHEPGCSFALASQRSRLALVGFGPVQY